MTAEKFQAELRYQSGRHWPKGYRRPVLHDQDGKRWAWNNRQQRYLQIDLAPPQPPMYRNSVTMCRNRNERRKAFGYTDTYSIRERGWPYAVRNGKPD